LLKKLSNAYKSIEVILNNAASKGLKQRDSLTIA